MSSAKAKPVVRGLRDAFTFATKDVLHYFPSHMARGMQVMQQKLKYVDCIMEVHDARIPFCGRNYNFRDTVLVRPHLLVLNKLDLANLSQKDSIIKRLKEEGIENMIYTNCKEDLNKTVKYKLIPTVMKMISNTDRYHRSDAEDYNLLVIGVPNVGKSSLINALRRNCLKKGKATAVGAVAGVTKSVLEKIKISNHPRIYVYDSPGILAPKVESMDAGMKLALCGNLKDHMVGEEMIADYMLYWMNTHEQFRYVQYYGLPEASDNILQVLAHIAKQRNAIVKQRSLGGNYVYRPNFTQAAQIMLRDFRSGHLGKVNLDMDDLLDS